MQGRNDAAIFCGSDQIARGVADTLRAAGRTIPGDVALVGFDNWEPMALGAKPPRLASTCAWRRSAR